MSGPEHPLSDDDLLGVLREAVDERATPSDSMVDMIMAGYDITNADTSLARLIEDTRLNELATVRSTSNETRLMGYESDGLRFEFELRPTAPQIVGHVDGADEGEMHLEQANHTESQTVDSSGHFEFSLPSSTSFRLRYRAGDGPSTATDWILP